MNETGRQQLAWVGHNLVVVENVDQKPSTGPTLAQLVQEGFDRR